MSFDYWAEAGELWVADGGEIRWHGRPEGQEVVKAAPLPDTEDGIVLLTQRAYPGRRPYGRVPNLVRCRPDGAVVWKADPPVGPDVFTEFRLTAGGLSAYSWSGFSNAVDVETGQIVASVFTK